MKREEKHAVHEDYTVTLEFVTPSEYAGRVWTIEAVAPKNFTFEGRALRAGDIISFRSFPEAIEGTIPGNEIGMLESIFVVEKADGESQKVKP